MTWARDSVAALQLIAGIAWRPSALSRWQLEGGGSAAAFELSDIGRQGNGSGWLRVRRRFAAHYGLFGGVAAGNTVRAATSTNSLAGDVGVWATAGAFDVEAEFGRARTQDSLLMAASRVFTRRPTGWLDMDDVALTVSWSEGSLDASVTQRWRTSLRGTPVEQAALQASVTWALTPNVAVVVSGGRQLADPVRGAPDATMMLALVRWSFSSTDTAARMPEAAAAVTRLAEGSNLKVRIRAPISARVEVAGSFSGWDPIPLTREGGYWVAEVHVAPGRHRVAYRIDGGPWRAPTQLAKLREFGGEVGLLIVP
ncbi:MAG: glycogen-binding domain-containing protein [Gemmatimonadetes bacterium]|nr:glycogen-binding domain-containing protein [Gemmatimonadota bacterium]